MTLAEFQATVRPCTNLHAEFQGEDCYDGEFAKAVAFGYVAELKQRAVSEKVWIVMTREGLFDIGVSTHTTLAEAVVALYDYCC
jgi:hypothetical protein